MDPELLSLQLPGIASMQALIGHMAYAARKICSDLAAGILQRKMATRTITPRLRSCIGRSICDGS